MRHPQLLVCDREGGLGDALRELARQRRWFFRVRRQPESCLRFLRRGNPGVLVLRLGGDLFGRSLERELKLLDRVAWLFPDTAALVVCAVNHAALIGLAWDLGARYVLLPAQPREGLSEIAAGLMQAVLQSASLQQAPS